MTQDQALKILQQKKNVFLTGEPGAGKTHTINRFTDWLREQGMRAEVTASTGIAATHINGTTVHSWAGLGIRPGRLSEDDVHRILSKEYVYNRIVAARVLIIDEVSMLNADTLDNIELVCRLGRRRGMEADQPFGGLQVVFVGDFFQLPPVSKDGPARFAFESKAWAAAAPVVCYLTEQHRQSDGEFLEILTSFRQGTLKSSHITRLAATKDNGAAETKLFTHNVDVDHVNDAELDRVRGEEQTFRMESSGIPFLVDTLKKQCLSPEILRLKVGALVMFTRNNFDAGYVNGTLGVVTGFNEYSDMPIVTTKSGKVITASLAEWTISDKGETKAQIKQIPLRLAWAITVHKSQGMSLDAAQVDLSNAFEHGQGYVALSRVRTLAGLSLQGVNHVAFKLHPKVVEQDELFRHASLEAEKNYE